MERAMHDVRRVTTHAGNIALGLYKNQFDRIAAKKPAKIGFDKYTATTDIPGPTFFIAVTGRKINPHFRRMTFYDTPFYSIE